MSERYEDEMYEVNDIDAGIEQRKQLIQQAEELKDEEDLGKALQTANQLQRQWRSIPGWESGYEEELRDQFEEKLDVVYDKRNQWYEQAIEKKEALIKEAKALSSNNNWKEASQKMSDLMTEWKQIPRTRQKTDDELWERFNEARQSFYQKKDEYWEDRKGQIEQAAQTKEELIEQANQLKDSTEWQQTGKKFQDLMTQWKEAGYAGKDKEQPLWDRFNEARQAFYSQRNEYYEQLHEKQQELFEQKQELIQQAKDVLEKQEFTREDTEFMKSLNGKWKEIGNAGKKLEDQIWPEFRQTLDSYFDELKSFNQQRHENWIANMVKAKERKLELIENQKRRIKRLEEDINGLVSESRMHEMEEEIDECEAFIKELEAQVEDIENRIDE